MNDFWTILIIIGTVQALFLSIVLLTGKEVNRNNKWLVAVLLSLAANMFEYCFSISGMVLDYPFMMGTSYPLLFCMGPFYFMYVQHQLKAEFRFSVKHLVHFLIPVLCLILMLPFYFTPASEKLAFITNLEKNGVVRIPLGQYLFMVTHILQTAFYFVWTHRMIRKAEVEFKDLHSNTAFSSKIGYVKIFNGVFLSWLAIYLTTTALLFIMKHYLIEIDYIALLTTSALMFVFSYTVLRNPSIFNERLNIEKFSKTLTLERGNLSGDGSEAEIKTPGTKYQNSLLTREKIAVIKKALETYFDEKKPWLNYDFKLSEVAKAISVPGYQISQVINQEFGLNFFDLVNKYRVDEAKRLLTKDKRDTKLLAIAFDAGFNSKATFNRVFKKFTSLTPSEFRKIAVQEETKNFSLSSQ